MSTDFPVRTLIVPSIVISVFSLILSVSLTSDRSQWLESVLEGLGSTFIGIIIAVIYVDRVQQAHERKQWLAVEKRVIDRIGLIVTDFQLATLKMMGEMTNRPGAELLRTEGNRRSNHVNAATMEDLQVLGNAVSHLPDRIDRILDTYGRFLSRPVFHRLMESSVLLDGVISNRMLVKISLTSRRELTIKLIDSMDALLNDLVTSAKSVGPR